MAHANLAHFLLPATEQSRTKGQKSKSQNFPFTPPNATSLIKSLHLLFLLLFFFSKLLFAQTENIRFRHLTAEDGLPDNVINDILQDKQGFIWIATSNGLTRYDGYNFIQYRNIPFDTNSLSDNYVYSICEDKNGIIWIGTYNGGLNAFDPATNKFTHYLHNPDDSTSISKNDVRQVVITSDGTIWAGTFGAGVNVLNPKTKKFKRYLHNPNDSNTIHCQSIWYMYADSRDRVWIDCREGNTGTTSYIDAHSGKVSRMNKSSGRAFEDSKSRLWIGNNFYNADFTKFTKTDTILPNFSWYTMTEDHEGNLWFCDWFNGLYKYDPVEGFIRHYLKNDFWVPSLSNNSVSSVFVDRSGVVWIGTGHLAGAGNGINICDNNREKFHYLRNNPKTPENTMRANDVRTIWVKGNEIYIGIAQTGIDVFNKETKKITPLNFPPWNIRTMLFDKEGYFWVGCRGCGVQLAENSKEALTTKRLGLINSKIIGKPEWYHIPGDFKDTNKLTSGEVMQMIEDSEGDLWITTLGKGLNHFDKKNKRCHRYLSDHKDTNTIGGNSLKPVFQTSDGLIWVGGDGGGLSSIEKKSGKVKRYQNNPGNPYTISSNVIFSIYEDSKKRLWIGTVGGGLNFFDREKQIFKHYSIKDRFCSDAILSIIEDNDGNLWLGTANGLIKFNPDKMLIRNFGLNEGLPFSDFNLGAVFKDEEGVLYFGGPEGMFFFNPKEIKNNTHVPPVVLTNFTVQNKPWQLPQSISHTKEITLSYREYFFTLEFSALDFSAPEKNQYAYKLEGFNKEWIELGNKREVTFTNLDAGDYVLKVKASNNHSLWSDEKEILKITITPPWWETTWFRVCVILLVIGVIIFYIKWREQKLKQEKETLQIKVNEATAEIREQKKYIEEKHKETTDSINYAKRLQQAILPPTALIKKHLPDSFVLYKPKDIVAGDFYWMEILPNGKDLGGAVIFLAAADCTGHGVPGAMVSVVCSNALTKALLEENITETGKLLDRTREIVISSFNKSEEEIKDGMDISLCAIDFSNMTLQWSGANNPLWLVRKNGSGEAELSEIRHDKQPIGINHNIQPFTSHDIILQKEDTLYIFTDGYQDQFGGDKGKKFKASQLKEKLLTVQDKTMNEQKVILDQEFEQWRGQLEQVDDVCVIGVRI